MKTKLLSVFLIFMPLVSAQAQEMEKYFSNQPVELTPYEKEAVSISQKWQAGETTTMKPFTGAGGSVVYVFGVQEPSLLCAVLQVCDIALQPGERISSVQLGDSARWIIEPAVSGSPKGDIQHVLVKPVDVGLNTSLVIATDRRIYHIRLKSDNKRYMSHIAFSYPEDALAKWEKIQAAERQYKDDRTIPGTGEYLGNLAFNYSIDGAATWRPSRVYNDGKKTIIEMSDAMQSSEAPSLLIVRKEGGLFSDDELVMVNYRIHGNRYIVDSVFDKAILVAGVGSSQDRVTITREGGK